MKHPNISFVLKMTKDFLDGKITDYEYRLDFPHEAEQRYAKMSKENQMLAELVWDCLVEPKLGVYVLLGSSKITPYRGGRPKTKGGINND